MSRQITTRQGDVVDQIAKAFYGDMEKATEAVLDANPHLADLPPVLPAGVVVTMPVLATTPTKKRLKLWE
ncbi:tail protein X [Brevundimonas faecalis]|uniref:tail protein X n=1 Tax=Brevundimonas faecalis TaxID=947378 RepID=UPI00360E0418